jgi:hypothetical protein
MLETETRRPIRGPQGPPSTKDPKGLYGGVDDAVFAGGGAIVGIIQQGIGDLLSGQLSSPGALVRSCPILASPV